jgi:uncharacterized protein (TIGR02186 family)
MKYVKIPAQLPLLLLLLALLLPAEAMAIHVTPEEVLIGTTYNGKDLYVTGEIAADEEAVIQIIGSSSEAEFKEMGKVAGLFWMTVAHLSISEAPSAYLIYLPKALSDWRQHEDTRWTDLNMDFNSLLAKVEIEPEPENKEAVFNEFLKLKTHDGLYQLVDNGVSYDAAIDKKKQFRAKIHIPAKIPVASYQVVVTRLKDGIQTGVETGEFHMREEGFPALISTMAFKRSLLYGILSVMIAIFAGLFMGVLFKDRGGAH